MSIYISDKNGNLKKVAGNSFNAVAAQTANEPVVVSASSEDLTKSEYLVVDISFSGGTTCRTLSGLNLYNDGGIYDIVVDIPKQTSANGNFTLGFEGRSSVVRDITLSNSATKTSGNPISTTVSSRSYGPIGYYNSYGPSSLRLTISLIENKVAYNGTAVYMTAAGTLNHNYFAGYSDITNLTSIAMVYGTKVTGCHLRVYKRPSNNPKITTGG